MTLLIMCGYPCSGKSTLVTSLSEEIQKRLPDLKLFVIAETTLTGATATGEDWRCEVFSDSRKERELRAQHKSEVERALTQGPTVLVIMDGCNYIKGYRYELYCLAKSLRHQNMILHCDVPLEKVIEWNSKIDRYSEQLINDLVSRFEPPNPSNRWDQPIMTFYPHLWSTESNEFGNFANNLMTMLTNNQNPVVQPNRSTQLPAKLSSDIIQVIEQVIQQVVDHITYSISIGLPYAELPKELTPQNCEKTRIKLAGQERRYTPANLARIRRRYINIQRTYMQESSHLTHSSIAQGFFHYLSTQSLQE